MSINERMLSHNVEFENLTNVTKKIQKRIMETGDKPYATVDTILKVLDQLQEFDFGRFQLLNGGGWNGEWTYHAINRPNLSLPYETSLEKFLYLDAPTVRATRERFSIFQKIMQESLKDNIVLASLPCGIMGDLLTLDYSNVSGYKLVGIDLDENSLLLAKKFADDKGLSDACEFVQKDVWNIDVENEYDLLTSNGLNIYEPDDEKVVELYRNFYKALKPGGKLITSYVTPPPAPDAPGEWDFSAIDKEALVLQTMITVDILQASSTCFRTTELSKKQLTRAGFKNTEITPGSTGMFPTVVAIK